MQDKLKEYGLNLRQSDSKNRDPIDFSIEDYEDNVAWAWGDRPDEAEVDCTHPYQCVEFGDDDEQGICALCGATCDWHWVDDGEGGRDREPHEWYPPKKTGGLIGEYLKEEQARW